MISAFRPRWFPAAWLLGVALLAAAVRPAVAGEAEDVQALVERAAAHIHSAGLAPALADFARPDGGFMKGELYVFCMHRDGLVLVNAGNPRLAGKVIMELHDKDGRPVIAEMINLALTQGSGWIDYVWPNPSTGHLQRKVTYVIKIDDQTMCGGGYYKPGPP
jgi:cytochrome c